MSEALPYAVGVAISPVAIATTLLLLTARGALAKGLAFLMGWTIGVALPILAFVVIVSQTDISDSDPIWIAVANLLLGTAFLLGAVLLWTRRRTRGDVLAPRLANLNSVTISRSAGLGVVLSGANPKVIALSLGAALAVGESGADVLVTAEAVVAFVAIGATGVAAPLAVYVAARSRARSILDRVNGWLGRHEVEVLVALGVLFGTVFLVAGFDSL
jgi:hypothetical protein